MLNITGILKDIESVILCMGILGLAYGANFIISIVHNIRVKKEKFDYKKIFDSLLKVFSILLAVIMLTTAIDLLGYTLDSEFVQDLSIYGLITSIGTISVVYAKDAIESLMSYLRGDVNE